MQDTLSSGESTELVRLWRRRQQLSPDEMGRMYAIVGDALRSCSPPELKVLGESRQELVAQFIYVKVLRLDADPDEAEEAPADAGAGSAPSTAFALCAYFRRYLIDCTRASSDCITLISVSASIPDRTVCTHSRAGSSASRVMSQAADQHRARASGSGIVPIPEASVVSDRSSSRSLA